MGGHHHGGHRGGRGGGMPFYPYPIQYPQSSEVFVVDSGPPKPAQICNPTPPIKPVPGTYKNDKGQYCWPAPGMSGLDNVTGKAWLGSAVGAFLVYRGVKKKSVLSGAAGAYLLFKVIKAV